MEEVVKSPVTWDSVWIEIAQVIAKKSKDLHTQVGCVLVSPDNRSAHLGFNGFPTGIKDTVERLQRPQKYIRMLHSESNAILNAKTDLSGWSCYLTMPPCDKCSLLLIQAGIKRIVYLNEPSSTAFDYKLSFELLAEAGVSIQKFQA